MENLISSLCFVSYFVLELGGKFEFRITVLDFLKKSLMQIEFDFTNK